MSNKLDNWKKLDIFKKKRKTNVIYFVNKYHQASNLLRLLGLKWPKIPLSYDGLKIYPVYVHNPIELKNISYPIKILVNLTIKKMIDSEYEKESQKLMSSFKQCINSIKWLSSKKLKITEK